jgi:hypothetical protein
VNLVISKFTGPFQNFELSEIRLKGSKGISLIRQFCQVILTKVDTIRTNDDQNIVNEWQQQFASTFVKITWQNCLIKLIPLLPLSRISDNSKFWNGPVTTKRPYIEIYKYHVIDTNKKKTIFQYSVVKADRQLDKMLKSY